MGRPEGFSSSPAACSQTRPKPLQRSGRGTRAEAEGIDEATGEELIWRLRERQLRRELQHAAPAKVKELQEALAKLLERVASLSSA